MHIVLPFSQDVSKLKLTLIRIIRTANPGLSLMLAKLVAEAFITNYKGVSFTETVLIQLLLSSHSDMEKLFQLGKSTGITEAVKNQITYTHIIVQ